MAYEPKPLTVSTQAHGLPRNYDVSAPSESLASVGNFVMLVFLN
jgi:hypothetical protein